MFRGSAEGSVLPPSDGQRVISSQVYKVSPKRANLIFKKAHKTPTNGLLVLRFCTVHMSFFSVCELENYVLKIVLINK